MVIGLLLVEDRLVEEFYQFFELNFRTHDFYNCRRYNSRTKQDSS